MKKKCFYVPNKECTKKNKNTLYTPCYMCLNYMNYSGKEDIIVINKTSKN